MMSLNTGATGMLAQELNTDVIANNIANLSTSGFKRSQIAFQDLLYQSFRRVGSTSSDAGTVVPAGVQVGVGVQAASVFRIHEQGTLQLTENPLDLAIDGRGFFQIELPDGEVGYTRAGNFQLNEDGEIVTVDGFLLEGPGAVPDDVVEISVNEDGVVEATLDGQVDPVDLGQIELAIFINPAGLEARGANLFFETPASGAAILGAPGSGDGFGVTRQGFVENSNVSIVEEITDLITAQRAYEMNSRVVSTADEILQTATNI